MSRYEPDYDALDFHFIPRIDWNLGEDIRAEDMDSLNKGIQKALQISAKAHSTSADTDVAMKQLESRFETRLTEMEQNNHQFQEEAQAILDRIGEIDTEGITSYVQSAEIQEEEKLIFTRGDKTTFDVPLPKNKTQGQVKSVYGGKNKILIDLDLHKLALYGNSATALLLYEDNNLTLDGVNFQNISELAVKNLTVSQTLELYSGKLSLQGLEVSGNTTLNYVKTGNMSSNNIQATSVDTASLTVNGKKFSPIYSNYKQNSNFEVWRTGNIVTVRIRPPADIRYLGSLPSWATPSNEISASACYHHTTIGVTIWCFRVLSSGSIKCTRSSFRQLDGGNIEYVANLSTGDIREPLCFSFGMN